MSNKFKICYLHNPTIQDLAYQLILPSYLPWNSQYKFKKWDNFSVYKLDNMGNEQQFVMWWEYK